MPALSDIKVVEFGEFISAPYCGKLLASLGAEVIKVEKPPRGDKSRNHGPFPDDIPHQEKSGLFLYLNTGKLGVTLNVETYSGRQILLKLLEQADVFLENNPPQVMKKLKLAYDTLKKINPQLIVTSVTYFGQSGPYKDYKGHDINAIAMQGVSYSVGDPDREPLTLPFSQADYQAGVSAAAATLTAIFARNATGRGQHVDVAATETFTTFHSGGMTTQYVYQGVSGKRAGHRRLDLYPYTVLPCKDGYMCLIAREGRQWARFLTDVINKPEIAGNPRYRNRRAMGEEFPDEVDNLLLSWLKEHTRAEIFALCQKNRVPFAPVRTVDELLSDEHLEKREFFNDIEHPEAGRLKYPGAPYQFSRTHCRDKHPAPLLGEHNEDIYCGRLGYSKEELVNLRRAGAI